MEASGEGNFSVSMNTSSSAPFQEERLGLGIYPGGVHVKIQVGMFVQYFGFEIRAQSCFFSGGGWRYLFRLRKATATGALFTHDCNHL